jgi:hypothetical protein
MYRYDAESKKIVFSVGAVDTPMVLSSNDILEHLNRMYSMLDGCAYAYQQLDAIFSNLFDRTGDIAENVADDDIKVGGTDE